MRKLYVFICVLAVILQVSCGGGGSSPVAASITPTAAALSLGQSIQFSATLPGTAQDQMWSVNGMQGGNSSVGTVDATGNYVAPTNSPSIAVTVTATSGKSSTTAQVYVVAPGTVTPTANPQVAQYTITPPAGANVSIQFGPTTSYGLTTWTQPTPTGGGVVSILVAGMIANSAYHMQAVVQFGGGLNFSDTDHTFTTGTPALILPTVTATTTAGMTPQSGVELLDLGAQTGKVQHGGH